jgi:hypothetical protein
MKSRHKIEGDDVIQPAPPNVDIGDQSCFGAEEIISQHNVVIAIVHTINIQTVCCEIRPLRVVHFTLVLVGNDLDHVIFHFAVVSSVFIGQSSTGVVGCKSESGKSSSGNG